MCVVIDPGAISAVFFEGDSFHKEYKPLRDWIIDKNGKIVMGGSTYNKEFDKLLRYRRFFRLLRDAGKIISYPHSHEIDDLERLMRVQGDEKFKDYHLVALLSKTKCKIFCSRNETEFHIFKKFFSDSNFFKRKDKPKIYSSEQNRSILSKYNIAEICQPCCFLNKEQKLAFLKSPKF